MATITGPTTQPIDREKVCPLLLRVFCSTSRHNNLAEYNRGKVPTNELQIYTWLDATLKELTALVREVNPDARKKGTFFDFSLVTPVTGGWGASSGPNGNVYHYSMRDIGTTVSGTKSPDDSKTLAQCRFTIGDYVDISISPPGGPKRFDNFNRFGDRDHRRDGGDRGGQRRGGGGGSGRGGGRGDRRPRPF